MQICSFECPNCIHGTYRPSKQNKMGTFLGELAQNGSEYSAVGTHWVYCSPTFYQRWSTIIYLGNY